MNEGRGGSNCRHAVSVHAKGLHWQKAILSLGLSQDPVQSLDSIICVQPVFHAIHNLVNLYQLGQRSFRFFMVSVYG